MSSRRRKGFKRRTGFENPKRFVVISTEGAETEPRYFNEFRTPRAAEIQIKLVPNAGHKSRPEAVLSRLSRFFRKNYTPKTDEGWIVIDRDAWEEDLLNTVCRDARDAGFQVAMSNPCFELWLYLHLRDLPHFFDRHDCQRRLAEILSDYSPTNKGAYKVEDLFVGIEDAIRRAKALDGNSEGPWPRAHGSRVYKLVESILRRT